MKRLTLTFITLSIFALLLVPSAPRAVEGKSKGDSFSALAYLPSGAGMRMVGAGATANLKIYIDSYTPDAEAQQYAQTLLQQGPDELLKQLEKAKAIGKVTMDRRVGFFDLKLIRSRPTENGRRIVGVCDRPIGFLEAYYSGRSLDNKFGIVILDLTTDKKGKEQGVGELIYAAKVTVLEGNKVEVENFGIDPVKMIGVRKF
ncbi:MAG TPA: hypothetical protein VI306_01870 [Pyrinomonadaceae bacterium]